MVEMLLCFLKMEAGQLEPTPWQCLQDSCSFSCLSSLTLLLFWLVPEQNSGLDYHQDQNQGQDFPCQMCCECSSSACVCGAGPPLAQACLIPAGRATSLDWGILPTLCCEQDLLLFHIFTMVWLLLPPQLSTLQDFTPTKGGKKQKKQ